MLAMDRENLRDLLARAPDGSARQGPAVARVRSGGRRHGDLDVPDPYYGGPRGFEHVLDLVEAACRGLLDEVRAARRFRRDGRGGRRATGSARSTALRPRRRRSTSTRPGRSSSTAGAARSSRPAPTRAPGEYATEAAGLAGWPSRARVACPAVIAVDEDRASWPSSGSTRAARRGRRGASSGAGSPRCTRGRAGVRRAAARRAGRGLRHRRARVPNDAAPDWPAFYAAPPGAARGCAASGAR